MCPYPVRKREEEDPPAPEAIKEAGAILGMWSAWTAFAAIPLVFVGLLATGFEPGVKPLLPVAWFWSLGFAAAFSHVWRERWSQFPRAGRPLSEAFKEIGMLALKGVGMAAFILAIGLLFGGGGFSW